MTPASAFDASDCAIFIITAFVLSGTAHVFWLRSRASLRFAFPLDLGLSFRAQRIFGDHKMFRGFVVMVPATCAAFLLLSTVADLWPLTPWRYAAAGALAGFGFMAGELPNSFLKRRLNIPPGAVPPQQAMGLRAFFYLFDRVDSILGMLLTLSLVVPVPLETWLIVLGFGAAIHWLFSAVLYFFGVKERLA